MPPKLLIGTSGHFYDEWHAVFYPPHVTKKRRLDYYASVFSALEINSTYYGTPKREAARRTVREAGGRLAFTIKAPGDMTHRGLTDAATVQPFLDYLQPYRDENVLTAVLLQFPNALRNTPEGRDMLRKTVASLPEIQLAVELRHESWDASAADDFFQELKVSRVAIDQPVLRGLSRSMSFSSTGSLAYFRFHGRNAAAWYGEREGKTGDARYRYRYVSDELKPWIPIVREAATKASSTLLFFNNHPDGNAVLDAHAFAEMLDMPLSAPVIGDLFS